MNMAGKEDAATKATTFNAMAIGASSLKQQTLPFVVTASQRKNIEDRTVYANLHSIKMS
jgi:hypothetical protein